MISNSTHEFETEINGNIVTVCYDEDEGIICTLDVYSMEFGNKQKISLSLEQYRIICEECKRDFQEFIYRQAEEHWAASRAAEDGEI